MELGDVTLDGASFGADDVTESYSATSERKEPERKEPERKKPVSFCGDDDAAEARIKPDVGLPSAGIVHAGRAFCHGRSRAQDAYDAGYAAYHDARDELVFAPTSHVASYNHQRSRQSLQALMNGDLRGHFLFAFQAAAALEILLERGMS